MKVFLVNENQPLSDGYILQDQIKVGGWKLTIYDGNMFQSNEASGIIRPKY